MRTFGTKLAIFLLLCALSGCRKEKDELTLPVSVDFKMALKVGISADSSLNDEYLKFNRCELGLDRITLTGKREVGKDILFRTRPSLDFSKLFSTLGKEPIQLYLFAIPQGTYKEIKWHIYISWAVGVNSLLDLGCTIKEINEAGFEDVSPDGAMFPVYAGPSILVLGTYEFLDGSVVPFVFAHDTPLEIAALTYDAEGSSRIVLSVDKEYESTLSINLEYAFHSLSREAFEHAEISGEGKNQVIIISQGKNEELFESLISQNFISAIATIR